MQIAKIVICNESGLSYEVKIVLWDNPSQDMLREIYEMESLTGESFCTIAKFLFLERRLDARLYLCLCSVLRFS